MTADHTGTKATPANLVEFLAARYDEIEAAAQAATPGPWRYNPDKHVHRLGTCEFEESVFAGPPGAGATSVARTGPTDDPQSMADARHIALHDPSHVLADIAAKRRLISFAGELQQTLDGEVGCCHTAAQIRAGECPRTGSDDSDVLRLLALPFVDHPDYQEEWKP